MGARVGLHSRRASRSSEPLVKPISQGWSIGTLCPACKVNAVIDVERRPSFRCPNARCPFSLGWRLELTIELESLTVAEVVDDGDGHLIKKLVERKSRMMIAVPLDADGNMRSLTLGKYWPPRVSDRVEVAA